MLVPKDTHVPLLAPRSLTWDPHPHSPMPSFKPSPGLSPAPACTLLSPCELHPKNVQYQGSANSLKELQLDVLLQTSQGAGSVLLCLAAALHLGTCSPPSVFPRGSWGQS